MAAPYADTVLTGTLGVDDVLTSKQARDVTKGLYMLYDTNNLAPMTAVLAKIMTGRPAKNYKIEWHKKDIFPHWDTVVTGASAGATAQIVITNADYFKVGDVLEFPDASPTSSQTDQVVVTAKSSTTLTLAPVGASTICAIANGSKVHILSDSSEEYSTMPAVKVVKDVSDYNYIHFMRLPYKIGNIQKDMQQYTGPERTERREETNKEIRMMFERQLIFGERDKKSGTTGNKFFMRGMKKFIESGDGNNILDWSAGLTESQLDEYLIEGPCKYGSQRKFWFMSSELFLKVHELAKQKQRIQGTVNYLGLALIRYIAPNGKVLYMIHHHMFEESYEGAGLILDPQYAEIRPYGTQGAFQFHPEIQPNDVAGIADEWRIIASLEVGRTEPHGWQHT